MGLLADVPKYYWDACAWIALIQQEKNRFDDLSFIVDQARDDKVEIWTSNFTLAEVFKRPCDGQAKGLSVVDDTAFEAFLAQADVVTRVQVDFDVGTLARRLLRSYPTIAKPQDAIHLATALLNDVDELHTYDRANLTGLSGKIPCKNGKKLKICPPPKRPPIPAPPPDLFTLPIEIPNEQTQQEKPKEVVQASPSPPPTDSVPPTPAPPPQLQEAAPEKVTTNVDPKKEEPAKPVEEAKAPTGTTAKR